MATESADAAGGRKLGAAGSDDVAKTLGLDKRKGRGRWVVRLLVTLAVVALAGALIARCVRARAVASAPQWKTAEVARADIQVTITATGTVKGLNTVEVGAEVSGKVTKVYVDWNDKVKKGQVLAEIDPEQQRASVDEATARVAEADASIRQARATVTETKQNAARAEQMAAQGLVSKQDLDAAKAAAERAQASLASAYAGATVARASLKSMQSKLERTSIVCPIDGVVLSRLVEPGQTVTAGFQTPVLFKLAEDLRRMSLHVFIDEADVGRAKEGQPASFTVDAHPDKVFPSKLISLRNEPKTEQNVVTYEAVLSADNGDLLLRPGMTATATIIAEVHKDVLAVPNAALRFTPPQTTARGFGPPGGGSKPAEGEVKGPRVWVLEGAAPTAVPVKIGASDGRMTEILEGAITPGTQVLIDVVEKGS